MQTKQKWNKIRNVGGADDFTLVVDDFRVKYTTLDDVHHSLPGMQLQIPVRSLYHPNPVPAGLASNITIDLFDVRDDIEDAFH
jgi:hypothetical protein